MPDSDFSTLKLLGNRVNASIMTFLSRHPMSPRDLSKYLGKNEADISRRLKMMEKKGLVEGRWGTRLGKNVKLYSLLPSSVTINFQQDGMELDFRKKGGPRRVERIDSKLNDYPQDMELLVGREQELEALSKQDYRFVCIVGVAGMGKSTLARAFAQKANHDVFWHAFKEIDTLTYLIGKVSAFMSQQGLRSAAQDLSAAIPAGNEWESGQLEAATDQLNRLKCVMVFDDFHKVKDEKITMFLKYLQQRSSNKVIVLTRSKPPFYIDDARGRELVLQGLPLQDAKKMMARLGAGTDENASAEIWRRFSGHPMSLKIYALAKARQPSPGDGRAAGSKDSISEYFKREIFEILAGDEQNILLTLSVFRTAVKSKAFKGANINQRNLAHTLQSLEKKMIISRTASDKFLIHDMLRDILYPLLAYPEDAHASAARYYLSEPGAENAVEALFHFSKSHDAEGMARILEEELIEEKYRLIEAGYAAPIVEIMNHVDLRGLGRDQLGYFYNIRGKALSMLYRWDEGRSDLEKTIKLSEDSSDRRLLAHSLRNYGDSLYLHGDFTGAEKRLLHAAKLFSRDNKADRALGLIYMRLARLYFATGRFEESKKYSDMAKSFGPA